MYLLWTERPAILDRERETHEWMMREKPWEQFGLELVYENKPGDWKEYSRAFHAVWARARAGNTGFVNVESDVVPTHEAFRAVLGCPHPICLVPYETYTDPDPHKRLRGEGPRNWGALIETRVPGGWDAHLATGTEEWAVGGDLGFIKFGPAACARVLPSETHLEANNGLLNSLVLDFFRSKDPRDDRGRVHLHWPGLRQNHRNWDAGDYAHWDRAFWPEMKRVHAEFIDPALPGGYPPEASPASHPD